MSGDIKVNGSHTFGSLIKASEGELLETMDPDGDFHVATPKMNDNGKIMGK